MKAAQLLLECLEHESVDYIFGLPGEENMDVLDALLDSRIEFVTTRHEQGAAFMADVYGRLTKRAGVCLATLGPGATNLITGVADANMDHAPLVAIAGQAGSDRLHKESHQVLDLQRLFQPVSKYSSRLIAPETVPEVVRKAFKTAQTERMGASFIELPENVAGMSTSARPVCVKQAVALDPASDPSERSIEAAAKLIGQARHPIILAGNGVIRAGATEALSEFASRLNIPVANTFMAKGVIPFKHPMALGSVGLQSNDWVLCGFSKADVIICVGYDLVEYHADLWHPSQDRTIVHIASVPHEVDAHYCVAASVVGDISQSLSAIGERSQPHEAHTLRPLRNALIEDMQHLSADGEFPIKPQRLIWELRTALRNEDVVICDVGAHKLWMARMFRCEEPNTCIISNGFAAMGIAVPGAIAAKLVYPDLNIVAVSGDAGFMMNCQEIETAIRLNTPIVIMIWNDGAYGVIEWKQLNKYKRKAYVDFDNPDFVKLAESFGALGYRVEHPDALQPILREALDSKRVCVIDCPVDYRENLRLTEKLGNMVCPV